MTWMIRAPRYPLRVVRIRSRLVSPMLPGLRILRIWFVPRLISSEYLLTMRSSQRLIRCLETQVSTLQAELGAHMSEIASLKLSLENATRAYSHGQNELASTRGINDAQCAEIANLRRRFTELQRSSVEELKKARMRPAVSIHSASCFQTRH
jgi:hypothetical protein